MFRIHVSSPRPVRKLRMLTPESRVTRPFGGPCAMAAWMHGLPGAAHEKQSKLLYGLRSPAAEIP